MNIVIKNSFNECITLGREVQDVNALLIFIFY